MLECQSSSGWEQSILILSERSLLVNTMKNSMKQRFLLLSGLLLFLLAANWLTAMAQTAPPLPAAGNSYVVGELLVKLNGELSPETVNQLTQKVNGNYLRNLYASEVQVWQVPAGSEQNAIQTLANEPAIAYAEPNYYYQTIDTLPATPQNSPNDPSFGGQWSHSRINSTAGWDLTTGSSDTIIAIIDTGIDQGHPDLASKLVAGYDFISNDSDPSDTNGHGTHVAGIATAITNNGVGIAGVNWLARIMAVRVLNGSGSGTTETVTNGIIWAYSHGAKILNLSLGGTGYSQTMQDAVNAAHANGSLVVAAMGNCRTGNGGCSPNATVYPAAFNNVMAVAATNPSDSYAYYSQYGNHCDISAPGGEMYSYHDSNGIYSTMPTYDVYLTTEYSYNNNYDQLQGTSQATPHVAGLAGLVWAMNPALTPDQVQTAIQDGADDLGAAGWDPTYGHGRINVFNTLQPFAVPAAPVLAAISNPDGNGDYLTDWNTVSFATTYTLQEDDNSAFGSPITVYSGSNSQYNVTGRSGGLWFYRVRGQNGVGTAGSWSNNQSVWVVPAAPTLSAISNPGNDDAYTVQWSTPAGATAFTLQEDDNPTFSSPTMAYAGYENSYQVTGHPAGTWYYRVSGNNPAGSGAWSNSANATITAASLAAPTLDPIANPDNDGQYDLSWSEAFTATGYVLEQSADPYFAHPTTLYTSTNTLYPITDQPGGTWFYRVRATGPTDNSPWSNSQSAIVTSYLYLPILRK